MFIGHFGLAFAAKRIAPRMSLGTAFVGAQLLDLMWPTFLLLGWERVRILPGATAMTPLVFEHYPLSHSLLAVVMWAACAAGVYAGLTRRWREAAVLGALVLSHWVLDALVHAPDLPLVPGGGPRVGLGLWNLPQAELLLEAALFGAGVWLYLRTTRATGRAGRTGLALLILFLGVIYLGNVFGPPPPSVAAIAWLGQAQWLLVLWAWWMDRQRTLASAAAS